MKERTVEYKRRTSSGGWRLKWMETGWPGHDFRRACLRIATQISRDLETAHAKREPTFSSVKIQVDEEVIPSHVFLLHFIGSVPGWMVEECDPHYDPTEKHNLAVMSFLTPDFDPETFVSRIRHLQHLLASEK